MNINVNKKHAESTNLKKKKKNFGYLRNCLVMWSPKMGSTKLIHGTERWIPVNLISDASNNEKHGSNKQ